MADTYTLVGTIDENDSIGGRMVRVLDIVLLEEVPTGNRLEWIKDANGDKIISQQWSTSHEYWRFNELLADMDGDGTDETDLVAEINTGDAMFWDGVIVIRYGEAQAAALTRIQSETLPAIRAELHTELQTTYAQKNREVYG